MSAPVETRTTALGIACLALLLLAACPRPQPRACARDVDCKGRRICRGGECVDPAGGAGPCPRPVAPTPARTATKPPPARPLRLEAPRPVTAAALFRLDTLRRGRSTISGPETRPRQAWQRTTAGPLTAAPALLPDGAVVVASQDGRLHAFGADGSARWTYATGGKLWSSPALSPDGKTIYVGSEDHHLHAVNAATGTIRWKLELGPCPVTRRPGRDAVRCDVDASPVVAPDGTIVVGGNGLYAVTPAGQLRWRFPTPERVVSSPALLPDGTAIFGSQGKRVYAVAADGKLRWELAAKDDVDGTPAIAPDGTAIVGSDDGRLLAITAEGKLRWAVVTGGAIRGAAALAEDGTIYAGSYDGKLYAIGPDGRVRWVLTVGGRIHASPVIDAAGRIYFGSQDDHLYAVSPAGKVLWSYRLPDDVDAQVILAPGGRIYAGCDSGQLFALDP